MVSSFQTTRSAVSTAEILSNSDITGCLVLNVSCLRFCSESGLSGHDNIADIQFEVHNPQMRRLFIVSFALICSCVETETVSCGESFCLPDDTAIVQRRSPVEDFNLYDVEGPNGKFQIYEGNAPQSGGIDGQRVSVGLDLQAILVRTENEGRILMKRSSDTWPEYLEVTG